VNIGPKLLESVFMCMELPTYFVVHGYKIYTFGIFLFLGFVLVAFVVWQEGRNDGFDEEGLFDLFLISILVSLVVSRVFFSVQHHFSLRLTLLHAIRFWVPGFDVSGAILGFLMSVFYLTKRWRWSGFRILDIFSISLSLGASLAALGYVALQKDFRFLLVFAACLFMYAGFSKLRDYKLRSGFAFSLFLFLNVLLWACFFRSMENLILYVLLFIMSIVNLVLRLFVSMPTEKNTKKFFGLLKKKLLSKAKRLEHEQALLESEDPYLKEGRDMGNAEIMDEALLEDAQKELTDIRKSSVSSMLSQTKKALAHMKVGKYGKCEVCGGPIEAGRLKAYPEATTCTSCFDKK
jgi:DnaK suppressor protein